MDAPRRRTEREHPQDNFSVKYRYDSDGAEIAAAEMAYRSEDISFSELYMFCQSFDKEVTVDALINALGRRYRGE